MSSHESRLQLSSSELLSSSAYRAVQGETKRELKAQGRRLLDLDRSLTRPAGDDWPTAIRLERCDADQSETDDLARGHC